VSLDTETPRRGFRGGKHAPKKTRANKPAHTGFFRRWWWLIVGLPLLGFAVIAGTLIWVYVHLELPQIEPTRQSSYVYTRTGDLLTTFHGAEDRTPVAPGKLTDTVKHAILAAEDDAFYQHPGVDPMGIARAAWTDLVARDTVQGGSTITQQVVKNVYAGTYETDEDGVVTYTLPSRSIGQKVRESLLAVKLESEFTKDQILATYLNTIYFGHGAYGIQAAAQTYYDLDHDELNVAQAAMLAGLVRAPSHYDPAVKGNEEVAVDRRNYVLDQMVENGWLDPSAASSLQSQKIRLTLAEETRNAPLDSEYFVDYTYRELKKRFGSAEVFGGGLRVATTIDLALQKEAEDAVRSHLPAPEDPAAAVVTIDARTGQVLAMVGGENFNRSKVNLATGDGGTGRQAGSAFKPFTLAAAMTANYSLQETWEGPSTISIPDRECYTDGEPWTLSNASDAENGYFTLEDATAYSVNTVYAQVIAAIGPQRVIDMARDLGIRSKLQPYCAATLGTEAVNPLEMTNAYATLANRGLRQRATPVTAVEDRHGDAVPTATGKALNERPVQVLSANNADLVTSALQGVVEYGTGTAADLGRPAAGKTGTAQEYVDAWFCGYLPAPGPAAAAPEGYDAAPQLVTCVWLGYPDGERPMESVEGVSPVYGGTIPASIWHDYMLQAVEALGIEPTEFPVPDESGHDKGPETPAPAAPPAEAPSATDEPSPTEDPGPTDEPSPSEEPPPTDEPSPTEEPSPGPGERPPDPVERWIEGSRRTRGT
jgi:penicillin-binding protein 1A